MRFKLISPFKLTGDQPKAVQRLVWGLKKNYQKQTLLGVTGSGKTFTMASVIEKIQRPTLVISPNKTLAAQLYQEFKEFFPYNAVHYFVSYYDYYQPEAYIPQTDTYIEKEAMINEEIDRLRHRATQSLLTRSDVLIVASVSCIYGIGSPESYEGISLKFKRGQKIDRQEFLRELVALYYIRNDIDLKRGTFRARGQSIEIHPITGEDLIRVEFLSDIIESISRIPNRLDRKAETMAKEVVIYPAKHFVTPTQKLQLALNNIRDELKERLKVLRKTNKLLEAQRLEQRTNYDLEMIEQTGYCTGIENYSRHLDFRKPGTPPMTLIDHFAYSHRNWLLFIDESHIGIPQSRGMYEGDKSRKRVLIDYGFRLPSALDNRPLKWQEFEKKVKQAIYVSATPGPYEHKNSKQIVEQLLRPTGLLDPKVVVKSTQNQISDLITEIKKRVKRHERFLITTLTKRTAEELAEYLDSRGIKAYWLHSDIATLERVEILRKLRQGVYEGVVGINLLREGLDLPEVSLVAILEADKEGFLRNETTLIQTMGRAARHKEGTVIMYADMMTQSMKRAIQETNRRRRIQEEYNKKHHIVPKSIVKKFYEPIIFS